MCLVIVNRKGVPHTVKIGRYANVIVDWMNKHSVNNSKEVRHCEQMVKLARSDDMLVAAYFGPTQTLNDEESLALYRAHQQASLDWDLGLKWQFRHITGD